MYWAPASAHGECDKLANASTIPRPSSKLIKLLTGLRGLMAWPTKNTTVTDLSKLLGMSGLIMTRRRKKGPCGETAGYREALRSRLLFYPNGYRHWHPKMNTEILQFSLPLTLKLVLKGLLKGQCSVRFHPSVPWPAVIALGARLWGRWAGLEEQAGLNLTKTIDSSSTSLRPLQLNATLFFVFVFVI